MKWWAPLAKTNDPVDFLAAVGVVLAAWLALAFVVHYGGRVLAHLAGRREQRWRDLIDGTRRATSFLLLFPIAAFAGALVLEMPVRLERLFQHVAIVALLLQVGLWANRFIGVWMEQKMEAGRGHGVESTTALSLLSFASRIVLWSLLLLLALDQLDFNITALVAGMGIGGVAVALAVQNILGDLFASLSIVLDKPFVVGDFIVVDSFLGTVERVGIKTTRLRSLDGELLIFSNADLLKSRVRNFQQMNERRVEFRFGVAYDTPLEKLKRIPQWLKAIVEAQPRARFDRAHFKQYGDSELVFEIVYFVLGPDYNQYMDVQQTINLAIYERFKREGVDFAYPKRMVYVRQELAVEPA